MHTNIPNIHLSVVIILSFRRSLTHTYSYVHYTIKNQEFQEKEERERIFIFIPGAGCGAGFLHSVCRACGTGCAGPGIRGARVFCIAF